MSKKILISVSSFLLILVSLIVAPRLSIFADDPFHISGALSEACTCSVPCTCSFGEPPSPHNYCYAVYAYGIKKGSYNGVKLDGLKIGGMETAKGNALYLDDSASPEQRKALEAVARIVTRISGDRMGGASLLGVKWAPIKQQFDDRQDMLEIGGFGSFKTNYIMAGIKRSRSPLSITPHGRYTSLSKAKQNSCVSRMNMATSIQSRTPTQITATSSTPRNHIQARDGRRHHAHRARKRMKRNTITDA